MTNLAEVIFLSAQYTLDVRAVVVAFGKSWPRRDWFNAHGDRLLVDLYRLAKSA